METQESKTTDELLKDYKRHTKDIDFLLNRLQAELQAFSDMLKDHRENNARVIVDLTK